VDELTGFARSMRRHAAPVPVEGPVVDTAGTGGSHGPQTFNISTVAAFVIAGAGVKVAKHGNRSISSQCGSADLMEALGVNIQLTASQIAACLDQTGIGFLFAPALHPAMKHAQPARLELKTRTVFNLLGPLTNPAGARLQLIGATSVAIAELMAHALSRLETEHAMVVHGDDGLDEITTTTTTHVFEVFPGRVEVRRLHPSDFGVLIAPRESLAGAGKEVNREITLCILGGEKGPARDIVVVNAAAALWLAGKATDFAMAARLAEQSIDSGAARAKLDALIGVSNCQ
jgi:anthranilate phosphoribosyltransferase